MSEQLGPQAEPKKTILPYAGPEEMAKSIDKPITSRRRSIPIGVNPEDFQIAMGQKSVSESDLSEKVLSEPTQLLKEQVMDVLASLTPIERTVQELNFGLLTGSVMSEKDIAEKLGMSEAEVSSLINSGLRKLRHPKRHSLDDYIDRPSKD